MLVLIPKGTTDTRGIGLLDNLWKVVEALIDTCSRDSLKFRDIIHWFRDGRGTGTAIMELKLAQELFSIDHDPLFLVLLYIHKAYFNVDRDYILQTLEGYVMGPCMCILL